MENSFQKLQNNFESKFDAQHSIEIAITQGLTTANVFSGMAELYIPIAAGAAISMSTGNSAKQQQFGQNMPDFDWKHKVPEGSLVQPLHPRERFQPLIPEIKF
jgi:hypothetical protein